MKGHLIHIVFLLKANINIWKLHFGARVAILFCWAEHHNLYIIILSGTIFEEKTF